MAFKGESVVLKPAARSHDRFCLRFLFFRLEPGPVKRHRGEIADALHALLVQLDFFLGPPLVRGAGPHELEPDGTEDGISEEKARCREEEEKGQEKARLAALRSTADKFLATSGISTHPLAFDDFSTDV